MTLLMSLACGGGEGDGIGDVTVVDFSGNASPLFVDQSRERGLAFKHVNGMVGALYMPEVMGSGAALFDADNDGDLDLYLVQGGELGAVAELDQNLLPANRAASEYGDRLLRNDLTFDAEGKRKQTFVDVTDAAGVQSTGYGMGVAVGDINQDGLVDVYVTNLGKNRLLLNRSAGDDIRFVDITDSAGVGDSSWSVSASFVDIDRDGWLDLYVANYVQFSASEHRQCRLANGAPDYCGPRSFQPAPNRLFRNARSSEGRFSAEAEDRAVSSGSGGALGVVAADLNDSGGSEIYVANDERPNLLWMNVEGAVRNDAGLAGLAVNSLGASEASMGVDAGDVDNDGDLDLIVTHLTGETHTLYINQGSGLFSDQTSARGLGASSLEATGFGARLFDYDNDGWLDLVVANGAVRTLPELGRKGDAYPLHQPNQLFRGGSGDGSQFLDVTDQAGPAFQASEVSRGVPVGDIDNDGDIDLVVTNNNGPARLLMNQVGQDTHWLGLSVINGNGSPAIGAEVRLHLREADGWATGSRRVVVRTDGGYASARDPRVVFGLGANAVRALVRVTWPDGTTKEWSDLEQRRYHTLSPSMQEEGENR